MTSNPSSKSDKKFCLDKPRTFPIGALHWVFGCFESLLGIFGPQATSIFLRWFKTPTSSCLDLMIFWSQSSRSHWFIINWKCHKLQKMLNLGPTETVPRRFSRFLHWKHREGLLPLGVARWQLQQSAGGQRHRVPCHLQSLRTGAVLGPGPGRSWVVNPNSQSNLGEIKDVRI